MKNIIRYILLIAGFIVIFIGIVITILYGRIETVDDFGNVSKHFTFSIPLGHVIIGIVLIGLSEIVNLLQKLVDHFVGIPEKIEPELKYAVNKEKGETSESIREEIKGFYAAQSILIDDILLTKLEDFYVVKRGNEKDLLELGGFHPALVSKERIANSAALKELLE